MSMSYDDDYDGEAMLSELVSSTPAPSQATQAQIRSLDVQFDQHLASMKKRVQDLTDRKSKQLCALWIKKLCESNNSLVARTIRNEYSSKLLALLETRETLKFPFSERPPIDGLKPYAEINERSKEEIINDSTLGSSYNIVYQSSDRLIDYQMKLLEAKYKEEKLNLQQLHSDELQKILDRKNTEIENIKSISNRKKKDYEDKIAELERKGKQVILDKEKHEKELNNLKAQFEKNQERKQIEFDKKMNEVVNKYDKDKFENQKKHTKAFQDLVDETNLRLKKVESEYNQQQLINDKVIYELENRTQLLKTEMEKSIALAKSLEADSKEKQVLIESLEKRLTDEINKNAFLENEMSSLKQKKTRELSDLTSKYQHELNSKTRELGTHANDLRDELSRLKQDYERRLEKLNSIVREKETALLTANNTIKQQKSQAEQALNDLKIEIEKNSNKLYEEMKTQMIKVEADLDKSKSIREKQAKEFSKQIEHLKSEHRKEIEKLNSEFEKEKNRILQSHEKVYSQFHHQLVDTSLGSKQQMEELTQTIYRLEQDLFESNELRKQQITELGLIRQEEKLKNEMEIERVRTKCEAEKKRLNDEIEAGKDEIKSRDEKIRRLHEKLKSVEESLCSEKNEMRKLKEALERERNEYYAMVEAEKNALKRTYSVQLSEFEKELEDEKTKCKSIERRIKQISYENEQNVLGLKMHYEERMKGLLPVSIKNDYEETISALRSQVESLQQRTLILQSEFDEKTQIVNSSYKTFEFN